jgi:hypothetical protein
LQFNRPLQINRKMRRFVVHLKQVCSIVYLFRAHLKWDSTLLSKAM